MGTRCGGPVWGRAAEAKPVQPKGRHMIPELCLTPTIHQGPALPVKRRMGKKNASGRIHTLVGDGTGIPGRIQSHPPAARPTRQLPGTALNSS
jgi:hypothetical protein